LNFFAQDCHVYHVARPLGTKLSSAPGRKRGQTARIFEDVGGGNGLDIMTGGAGEDTFLFDLLGAFNNIDTVTDFSTGEGDVINIADLLSGFYTDGVDDILDFVLFEDSGADTVISVDRDGAGGLFGFQQIAVLTGVNGLTDEEALVTSGNLVVA